MELMSFHKFLLCKVGARCSQRSVPPQYMYLSSQCGLIEADEAALEELQCAIEFLLGLVLIEPQQRLVALLAKMLDLGEELLFGIMLPQ